eukprot:3941217-Rhodomonas_salina.3
MTAFSSERDAIVLGAGYAMSGTDVRHGPRCYTAKSNTRKQNLSAVCTRNSFSCVRCRGYPWAVDCWGLTQRTPVPGFDGGEHGKKQGAGGPFAQKRRSAPLLVPRSCSFQFCRLPLPCLAYSMLQFDSAGRDDVGPGGKKKNKAVTVTF